MQHGQVARGCRRPRRRGGRRGRRRGAREGHRPLERRRDLRRQGHRLSVLEARPARPRLPLPRVRRRGRTDRCGRPAAPSGETDHPLFGGAAYVYNVIDVRQSYLQKLLKQALIAVGPSRGRRAVAPLLVRDGGAVARHRARAGLRAGAGLGRGEAAVRRGLGPQGARRQGRRPARHADRARPAARSASATPELSDDETRRASPA